MGMCSCVKNVVEPPSSLTSSQYAKGSRLIKEARESSDVAPTALESDEDNDILANLKITNNISGEEKRRNATSFPVGAAPVAANIRFRNISEPISQLSISYTSKVKMKEEIIQIDESLVDALMTNFRADDNASRKLSLSRRSIQKSHQAKWTNITDMYTIRKAECSISFKCKDKSEIYKLIILLREVWVKLDVDKDDHLNMAELKNFCKEIWSEPKEDGGASLIMNEYAKVNSKKGLNFAEWCILIRDEDPKLQDFVEEIYDRFLDESTETEEDFLPSDLS
jgi:hypothetical protein